MDLLEALKNALPTPVRKRLSAWRRDLPRKMLTLDRVTNFSVLRRTQPYRRDFGVHRGQCIDRYYIEAFLLANKTDIRGQVLEVQSSIYTMHYGGSNVVHCDVIDVDESNVARTIPADLTRCEGVPDNTYDCVVLPQTLMLIYDFEAVVRSLHRVLKPGGILLATFPGIAQLCPPKMLGAGTEYWRFTRFSATKMFSKYFGSENTQVASHGNVLSAVAFLHGLVVEELTKAELDYRDPDYEVTITVRARKAQQDAP